jgi:hypothetical protein
MPIAPVQFESQGLLVKHELIVKAGNGEGKLSHFRFGVNGEFCLDFWIW